MKPTPWISTSARVATYRDRGLCLVVNENIAKRSHSSTDEYVPPIASAAEAAAALGSNDGNFKYAESKTRKKPKKICELLVFAPFFEITS